MEIKYTHYLQSFHFSLNTNVQYQCLLFEVLRATRKKTDLFPPPSKTRLL